MNFELSEEERLLKSGLERFVQDHYGLEKRRQYLAGPGGYDPARWRALVELGLTAIPFSEADGGLDWGPAAMMVVMDQIGRGLMVEPYLPSVVFAGAITRRAGGPLATQLAAGECIATVAHAETAGRFRLSHCATTASRKANGWVLNGSKALVLHGAGADQLIVAARTSGDIAQPEGISLFALPAGSPGVELRGYRTVDGQPAANLTLRKVEVPADGLLGQPDAGYAVLEEAVAEADLALSAEAVGAMAAVLDETLGYVKTRKQFGVSLGSFQALQHRLADCYIKVEQATSLVYRAVMASPADRAVWLRQISATKAWVSEAGVHVGEECIQFHGGMGVSDELVISHYHKRLKMIATLFGDAQAHWDRCAA